MLGTKVVPPDAQINLGGGTRDTLIPNLLGSIVGSYDSAGALTKFGYQPYGTGSPAPQFAYTGQRIDPETGGLYYYRARHYSTAFGRFLQPDPIGYGGGMHLYGYVENDPLNAADPQGLATEPTENSSLASPWAGGFGGWSDSPTGVNTLLSRSSGLAAEEGQNGFFLIADKKDEPAADVKRFMRQQSPPKSEEVQPRQLLPPPPIGFARPTPATPGGSGQQIVFGTNPQGLEHALRHVEAIGLNRTQVMQAIQADLQTRLPLPAPQNNAPFNGSVTVNGVTLNYSAYPLPNGLVNVGRITPQ